MYKARFYWIQDISYPIYKQLLEPLVGGVGDYGTDISGGGFSGFESPPNAKINLDLDIVEDFTYEIKSNYQNYGEVLSNLPFVGSLMGYMETMNSLSGLSGSSSNSSEWLKFQVWKETEPFKMTFKFVLSTYTDPFVDVYAPAMALSSMSILSPVKEDKGFVFHTPGVNSAAISGLSRVDSDGKKVSSTSGTSLKLDSALAANKSITNLMEASSKIIKEFIIWSPKVDGGTKYKEPSGGETKVPGIPLLKVKNCFIETAKPTWSKDRTASGIPIWCELELGIQSIFSANDSMFSYLTKSNNLGGAALDAAKKVATNIFR